MCDLESCVARRDAIVDQTEARERKSSKGSQKTRYNFQKNLENLYTKIKQVNSVSISSIILSGLSTDIFLKRHIY
jgi:hypothetical protein